MLRLRRLPRERVLAFLSVIQPRRNELRSCGMVARGERNICMGE
jgi:hypothetical protein